MGPGQLAQFPTRQKTNSPNFGQLAQKPTRPITDSPNFGQLAQISYQLAQMCQQLLNILFAEYFIVFSVKC